MSPLPTDRTLFVLLPEIGTYGCVALLARAWVRRRGLGWLALLVLGLAWAVAEEFLIIQTSVTPLIGVHPADTYGGRALGVSWVWMVFALVYESVWPLLVATQLAELLFPDRRAEPWIGRRGAIIAAVAFVPSAFVAWFGWTQSAEKQYFGRTFPPPRPWLLAAAIVVVALVVLVALLRRPRPAGPADRDAPPAWLVGTVVGVLATAWVAVSLFAYGAFPHVPVAAALVGAAVVAVLAFALIRRWSAGSGWGDRHRLALVAGALAGNMLGGLPIAVGASGGSVPALVFKAAVDLAAVALLVRLRVTIGRREADRHADLEPSVTP